MLGASSSCLLIALFIGQWRKHFYGMDIRSAWAKSFLLFIFFKTISELFRFPKKFSLMILKNYYFVICKLKFRLGQLKLKWSLYICVWCVCTYMCMHVCVCRFVYAMHTCGGQGTTFGSQFSPSALWRQGLSPCCCHAVHVCRLAGPSTSGQFPLCLPSCILGCWNFTF